MPFPADLPTRAEPLASSSLLSPALPACGWGRVRTKGDIPNICVWGMQMDRELGRGYFCVIHVLGAHAVLQLSKLILWVIQVSSSCHSPRV